MFAPHYFSRVLQPTSFTLFDSRFHFDSWLCNAFLTLWLWLLPVTIYIQSYSHINLYIYIYKLNYKYILYMYIYIYKYYIFLPKNKTTLRQRHHPLSASSPEGIPLHAQCTPGDSGGRHPAQNGMCTHAKQPVVCNV